MTREEAITILSYYDMGFYDINGFPIPAHKLAEACDMAIDALSAQTDGDLISRSALIKQIEIDSDGSPGWYGDTWQFMKTIAKMPSTDRKGQWIIHNHVDRMGNPIGVKICVCDQCKEQIRLSWRAKVPNYCSYCGADMRGARDGR